MKKAALLGAWVAAATLVLGHLSAVHSDAAPQKTRVTRKGTRAPADKTLLTVAEAATPTLSVSSLGLFRYVIGGPPPAAQTLQITSQDIPVSYSVSVSSDGSWADPQPRSGTTPADVRVAANPAGLAPGTYNSILTIQSPGVTNPSVPTQATLVVTAPNFAASPSALNFAAQVGDSAIQTQTVTLTSDAPISVTALAGGGDWLSVTPNKASAPGTVKVLANPAGLTAGTYTGSVSFAVGSVALKQLSVRLTVASAPSVTASPATFDWAYDGTGPQPSGAVQVIGSPAGAAFAAVASTESGGNWLSATPSAGVTPADVTISVNAGSLSSGVYTGAVNFSGPAGSTGSSVRVTLTVTRPRPKITAVVNAASYDDGPIAPGELITIAGVAIGPETAAGMALDDAGFVQSSVGGVQVIFLPSGVAAPLTYVGKSQINAVVPYEVAGGDNVTMVVRFAGQTSATFPVSIAPAAPSIFTYDGSGKGAAAILNADGSMNSTDHPAPKGSAVVLFVTGEGQTAPAGVTGKVTTVAATPPLTPQPVLSVRVRIGGKPATILFSGEAPGLISGLLQLNVVVPPDADAGNLPIEVAIGDYTTKAGITIAVR